MRTRLRKTLMATFVLLGLSATLSGCSPAISGLSGLTKNSDGSLVAIFQSCDYALATAYFGDANDEEAEDLGRWAVEKPSKTPPSLVLSADSPGWRTEHEWSGEYPAKMLLVAYSQDSTSYTAQLTFTQAETKALKPGQVLTPRGVLSQVMFDRWCAIQDD